MSSAGQVETAGTPFLNNNSKESPILTCFFSKKVLIFSNENKIKKTKFQSTSVGLSYFIHNFSLIFYADGLSFANRWIRVKPSEEEDYSRLLLALF